MLTACNTRLVPSVGQADNAIVLRAGISEGPAGVQTKAVDDGHAGTASGGAHKALSQGTKLSLRVDGTWLEKGFTNNLVSKTTTATVGGETSTDSQHNELSLSPQLYWDDYGSADPANIDTPKGTASVGTGGRGIGLTIYGAAVDDGGSTSVVINGDTGKQWNALSWTLSADQKGGWSTKDILTSNNVRSAGDGTYKFDDAKGTSGFTPSNILEFTHAMTKVTVNLKAGDGFVNSKFVNEPSVTLLGFNYTGTVNVETKTSTPTADTKTNISAHLAKVKATSSDEWSDAPATWVTSNQTQFDALVFPGNTITNTSTDYIIELNADGNIYKINGTKLYAKMGELSHGYVLKQGVNYILNITVNKTKIDVEATIKDWVSVSAANEAPVININESYGHDGTAFARDFDFYRSTTVNGSYLSGIDEGNHTVVTYVPAGGEPIVSAHYEMVTQMYWPNHSTHYFFRGIWPLVDSKDGESQPVGPTTSQVKANSIVVENVAYKQGYYPSDLMIGLPRKDDGTHDETCKVSSHDKTSGANGICATEGKIRMNFEYAMSQVIVNLSTSDGNDAVIFDDATKVEIMDGYTTGEIKLSDETSDFSGKSKAPYTMHREGESNIKYHDAIIPQSLQDGSGNATLKFKITVKSGDTLDEYETVLGIKNIQVTESGVKKSISAWERGKKYTYNLQITKTGIKVEATIKDWVSAVGGDEIWL